MLGALGECKAIGNLDANTLTSTQLYQISYNSVPTITNKPSSASQPTILVCIAAFSYNIQIWFESVGNCYFRFGQGPGSNWSKWFKFTTTELQ